MATTPTYPKWYKTPEESAMEQAKIIRENQLIQNSQNNRNFFDSIGQGPAQAQATQSPFGLPLQMRQQMMQANMMSPNQLQGSFNNTGLMLGAALQNMFAPKAAQQATQQIDPSAMEDAIKLQTAQKIAQAVKEQGVDPVEATRQQVIDLIKRGADSGNPTYTSLGMKLLDQYQEMAKKKADIDKFTPKNLLGPDGKVTTATTPEQFSALTGAGFTLTGDTPQLDRKPIIRDFRVGTDVVAKESFDNGKTWQTLSTGQNAQYTGEIPKTSIAKREDIYSQGLAATNSILDMKDKIMANVDASPSAGSHWGRKIVNLAGNIGGTLKSIGVDASITNPDNYKDVLVAKKDAIDAAGLNETSLIRLATLMAAQEKLVDGEANRTSVADVKLKLESIGAGLGNPETFKKVMDDVSHETVGQMGNKIENDLSFDKYPWAQGVRDRFKKLQDRIGSGLDADGVPTGTPDNIKAIIMKARGAGK